MLEISVVLLVAAFITFMVCRLPAKKSKPDPKSRLIFAMVRKGGVTHLAVDATNKKAA